jgi:Protein of unknown function (DUF3455)
MRGRTRFISLGPVFLAVAAFAAEPVPPDSQVVPGILAAPADQVVGFRLKATGVQIYLCRARQDDPARFEWVFKAPEADLFDASGHLVGRHYGGPSWEGSDGSLVVGEVRAKDTSLAQGSIPWLLLSAKSTSGRGRFGPIKSIQRVNTTGGAAPAEASQIQAGQEVRVPYTATYVFYVAGP